MAETATRKPAAKRRAPVTTVADKELAAMKAVMRDITSSKDKAKAFLRESGLVGKDGRLAKHYRG